MRNTVRKTKWDLIIKGLENHRNLQALSLSSGNCKCLGSMMIQKTCAWYTQRVYNFPPCSYSGSKWTYLLTKYFKTGETRKTEFLTLTMQVLYVNYSVIPTNLWSKYCPHYVYEETKAQEIKQTDHSKRSGKVGARPFLLLS